MSTARTVPTPIPGRGVVVPFPNLAARAALAPRPRPLLPESSTTELGVLTSKLARLGALNPAALTSIVRLTDHLIRHETQRLVGGA